MFLDLETFILPRPPVETRFGDVADECGPDALLLADQAEDAVSFACATVRTRARADLISQSASDDNRARRAVTYFVGGRRGTVALLRHAMVWRIFFAALEYYADLASTPPGFRTGTPTGGTLMDQNAGDRRSGGGRPAAAVTRAS